MYFDQKKIGLGILNPLFNSCNSSFLPPKKNKKLLDIICFTLNFTGRKSHKTLLELIDSR